MREPIYYTKKDFKSMKRIIILNGIIITIHLLNPFIPYPVSYGIILGIFLYIGNIFGLASLVGFGMYLISIYKQYSLEFKSASRFGIIGFVLTYQYYFVYFYTFIISPYSPTMPDYPSFYIPMATSIGILILSILLKKYKNVRNYISSEYNDILLNLKGISDYIDRVKKKDTVTIELEKKSQFINNLIQKNNIKMALEELIKFKETANHYSINRFKNWAIETIKLTQVILLRKEILDMGIQFARIQIQEIMEKTEIYDEGVIENVIQNMIENKEIYAEYFSSSKTIAFDKQANMIELDKLLALYKEWEEGAIQKKV